MLFLVAFAFVLSLTLTTTEPSSDHYFTAAVVEHARYDGLATDSPAAIVQYNLAYYKRAAKIAKSQKADIIVFPEYGIFPPAVREDQRKYLENTPDPKKVRVNPCNEFETYAERLILYALSCMAKENSIVVVANTGDIQPCEGQPDCPHDGVFQYNTNLAFDNHGNLIAKYYKEHLFFEMAMDVPKEDQDPIVETDFGTFAMFICFDIVFEKMSKFAGMREIDAILFSAMWIDSLPSYAALPFFHSWAMGNNATLLSTNIQLPGRLAVGSGIFQGRQGAVVYTFNPDGISKVLVGRVAKSRYSSKKISPNGSIFALMNNGSIKWEKDGKDVPSKCSYDVLGHPKDILKDYRCLSVNFQNYTLVKLTKPKGHIEACNNGMCCFLDYSAKDMQENFYFGINNDTFLVGDRYSWTEENCFMSRCDDLNETLCKVFPLKSKTIFHRVHMAANFTTKYVYPSVYRSGMRLVPVKDWSFKTESKKLTEGVIDFESESGEELLAVSLKGRCYDRDPPYVR